MSTALGLEAADAVDACLLSGGLPGILRAWPEGVTALAFAETECEDPASPLFGIPEAALLAEFPAPDMTRRVIEAIGSRDSLQRATTAIPGFEPGRTALAAVSRTGVSASASGQLALCWGPREVVAAFPAAR